MKSVASKCVQIYLPTLLSLGMTGESCIEYTRDRAKSGILRTDACEMADA